MGEIGKYPQLYDKAYEDIEKLTYKELPRKNWVSCFCSFLFASFCFVFEHFLEVAIECGRAACDLGSCGKSDWALKVSAVQRVFCYRKRSLRANLECTTFCLTQMFSKL